MKKFSGIWVPLVTPFVNGEVDYKAAQNLAAHMLDKGVHGLVVCSTTGEGCSLNHVEKSLLAEAIVDAAQGRCPVFMGLNGSNTHEVAAQALAFKHTGIDGYMLSAPNYVRPSQEGIIGHFQHIARAVDLPIIIYNIPSRTGVNMEPQTIASLCKHKPFVAIKECGGLAQLITLMDNVSCPVLCGEDDLILTALDHGAHGAISASANVYPEYFVALYHLMQQGNLVQAQALFKHLLPLIQLLFSEPNPGPVKAALALQGWIDDELRLPMLPATLACKEKLREALYQLGNLKPDSEMKGVDTHAA